MRRPEWIWSRGRWSGAVGLSPYELYVGLRWDRYGRPRTVEVWACPVPGVVLWLRRQPLTAGGGGA